MTNTTNTLGDVMRQIEDLRSATEKRQREIFSTRSKCSHVRPKDLTACDACSSVANKELNRLHRGHFEAYQKLARKL